MKKTNEYQEKIDPKFFAECPKSVLAAIAVSFVHLLGNGEKYDITDSLHHEWWVLYDNGIVPQKPRKMKKK